MDIIYLELPAKPEYVSTARLTTSAVANRMDFCVDDLDDLKVAVAESIIYLINQFINSKRIAIEYKLNGQYDICVSLLIMDKDSLVVNKETIDTNELGLYIIESMVDKVEKIVEDDIIYGFKICKACGGKA